MTTAVSPSAIPTLPASATGVGSAKEISPANVNVADSVRYSTPTVIREARGGSRPLAASAGDCRRLPTIAPPTADRAATATTAIAHRRRRRPSAAGPADHCGSSSGRRWSGDDVTHQSRASPSGALGALGGTIGELREVGDELVDELLLDAPLQVADVGVLLARRSRPSTWRSRRCAAARGRRR